MVPDPTQFALEHFLSLDPEQIEEFRDRATVLER